jgi:hypothetical protein
MSLKAKKPDQEFELVPTGTHLARCIWVVDLGDQYSKKYEKWNPQILLAWELDEKMESGEPFIINQTYTNSLGERANLRKHLESWRGRAFTEDELEGFSLSKLLNQWCMITVIHNESGGRTYANVGAVIAPDKVVREHIKSYKNPPHNPIVEFDMDNPDDTDFRKLPDWVQVKIHDSRQYGGYEEPEPEEPVNGDESYEDQDVPF